MVKFLRLFTVLVTILVIFFGFHPTLCAQSAGECDAIAKGMRLFPKGFNEYVGIPKSDFKRRFIFEVNGWNHTAYFFKSGRPASKIGDFTQASASLEYLQKAFTDRFSIGAKFFVGKRDIYDYTKASTQRFQIGASYDDGNFKASLFGGPMTIDRFITLSLFAELAYRSNHILMEAKGFVDDPFTSIEPNDQGLINSLESVHHVNIVTKFGYRIKPRHVLYGVISISSAHTIQVSPFGGLQYGYLLGNTRDINAGGEFIIGFRTSYGFGIKGAKYSLFDQYLIDMGLKINL